MFIRLRNRLMKKAGYFIKKALLLFIKVTLIRLAWLTANYVFKYIVKLID